MLKILGLVFIGVVMENMLKLSQCHRKFLLIKWFQQVIDTVYLKCFDGVFIISGREYDGCAYLYMIEYFETVTVCQTDIHKNQINGICFQKRNGIDDRFGLFLQQIIGAQ